MTAIDLYGGLSSACIPLFDCVRPMHRDDGAKCALWGALHRLEVVAAVGIGRAFSHQDGSASREPGSRDRHVLSWGHPVRKADDEACHRPNTATLRKTFARLRALRLRRRRATRWDTSSHMCSGYSMVQSWLCQLLANPGCLGC